MGNGTSCRSIRTVIKLEIKHFVIWLIARILLIFIVGYVCNRMVISYIAQRTKLSFIDWPESYTFWFRLTRYLEAKEEEQAMQELQTIPPLSQSQMGKKNSKKKISGEFQRK